MPTYERLDYGSPDGSHWGGASTDALGFYGAVPQTQLGITSLVSTTVSISTAGVYGFQTSTEAMGIVRAVSSIAQMLVSTGLFRSVT
jgi:hypothetical protein